MNDDKIERVARAIASANLRGDGFTFDGRTISHAEMVNSMWTEWKPHAIAAINAYEQE